MLWVWDEAIKIKSAISTTNKDEVIFECGYGPSGLPHLGTFAEVFRTEMVRFAFNQITNNKYKTKLIVFSDDLDGLRKIPDNIPNKDVISKFIDYPLSSVPNPFPNEYKSFAHNNNAKLRDFLDMYHFDYEFLSSTDMYNSGRFNDTIHLVAENYDAISKIIIPTLGTERQKTYSPFLPIDNNTGKIYQCVIDEIDTINKTILYKNPDTNEIVEQSYLNGGVKCQWKVDWAMRWMALGIDYEMAGKDLIDSVKLSTDICKKLNKNHPINFIYELFLDENGQKISKSKGNGITIDEWMDLANKHTLEYYLFNKPTSAKKLHYEVIPQQIEMYNKSLSSYVESDDLTTITNPVYFIHKGNPPKYDIPVSYSILLSLVQNVGTTDKNVIWGFINKKYPNIDKQTYIYVDYMVSSAISYYDKIIKNTLVFREPTNHESITFGCIIDYLSSIDNDTNGVEIQSYLYEIGRKYYPSDKIEKDGRVGVRQEFFRNIYQVIFGSDSGPRLGSFIELYGIDNTISMIKRRLSIIDNNIE